MTQHDRTIFSLRVMRIDVVMRTPLLILQLKLASLVDVR